jgi:hypothetical protein
MEEYYPWECDLKSAKGEMILQSILDKLEFTKPAKRK